MASLLSQFRFKPEAPVVARAALRGIGVSLNFSIAALVTQHLRQLRFGQAVEVKDEHYGHDVDQRNEIDVTVEGEQVEATVRHLQGFQMVLPPLELAARLKVILDSCTAELDAHAGMRMNPITKQLYKNEFDIVQPLQMSLEWQLQQGVRIDNAVVQKTAQLLGLDEASIRLQLEKQHETAQKFVKDNLKEIYSIIDNLVYKGEDGHAFTIEDDESVEERLPAINRARLFVAADKGLWAARNREVGLYMRGSPQALGNIGLIDGNRELLHAKFNVLMKKPEFKDEIMDAVNRGARYPTLLALFPKVQTQQAA